MDFDQLFALRTYYEENNDMIYDEKDIINKINRENTNFVISYFYNKSKMEDLEYRAKLAKEKKK
jgi:hypothetical protein